MYTVTKEQLELIIGYIATKPYNEVSQLINMLVNLPKQEDNTEEANK